MLYPVRCDACAKWARAYADGALALALQILQPVQSVAMEKSLVGRATWPGCDMLCRCMVGLQKKEFEVKKFDLKELKIIETYQERTLAS